MLPSEEKHQFLIIFDKCVPSCFQNLRNMLYLLRTRVTSEAEISLRYGYYGSRCRGRGRGRGRGYYRTVELCLQSTHLQSCVGFFCFFDGIIVC